MASSNCKANPSPTDVLLYVPNLIGYSRVLLTLASLVVMLVDSAGYWNVAICLYIASFVGDLLDGWVARKLQQTSSFGGVLDMMTDRCSTLGLLYVLGNVYQDKEYGVYWQLAFLGVTLLDISSHWCQMYASLTAGAHHKSAAGNEGRNFLVRWFYQYYYFFGYLCVGAEFTYVLLYVISFVADKWKGLVQAGLLITTPGCLAKQCVNLAQLVSAAYAIAAHDAEDKQNENGTAEQGKTR
jgi:CDP-diacylglycerol--inositol 3-phosphatidyltransferase